MRAEQGEEPQDLTASVSCNPEITTVMPFSLRAHFASQAWCSFRGDEGPPHQIGTLASLLLPIHPRAMVPHDDQILLT